MTFAYYTVLVAAILPLAFAIAAKLGAPGYDNRAPRVFLAGLGGWPQRADWAQANALEAFPPFAAGVIIAHVTGGSQPVIDALAGLFILARISHGVCYVLDRQALRSFSWLAGFACTLGLFAAAGR